MQALSHDHASLAGPEAEREFCGPISDDGDRIDYEMAREYLARQIANPLPLCHEANDIGAAVRPVATVRIASGKTKHWAT